MLEKLKFLVPLSILMDSSDKISLEWFFIYVIVSQIINVEFYCVSLFVYVSMTNSAEMLH